MSTTAPIPKETRGFLPADVDTTDGLRGTFGCVEFEKAIVALVEYIKDDTRKVEIPHYLKWGDYAIGELRWTKLLTIDSLPGVDHVLFAMLCASGWLRSGWFPKGTFYASDELVQRLHERQCKQRPEVCWIVITPQGMPPL